MNSYVIIFAPSHQYKHCMVIEAESSKDALQIVAEKFYATIFEGEHFEVYLVTDAYYQSKENVNDS